MKILTALTITAGTAAIALAAPAHAAINVTQQSAPAPTYSNLITFDEPGTPAGGLVPSNYWSSLGITITDGVNGANTVVDDVSGFLPWINTGNVNIGTFGVFLSFNSEVSSMSFQAWDPSGPPDLFGNGLAVLLFDVNDNFLGGNSFTGAWGGIGDEWFDVTTTGGDTFRKAVIFNNSFDPTTFVDNLSWEKANVPAPGALALLTVAGMLGRRRTRIAPRG